MQVLTSLKCLAQYPDQDIDDVREWKSKFQFCCINIVLYLSTWSHLPTWSHLLISKLVKFGALKATRSFQFPDLNSTLPVTLMCAEMAIKSILHLPAYPDKP